MRRPRRRPRRARRRTPFVVAGAVFALSSLSMLGLTAANVVPASRADLETRSAAAAEMAPAACAGLPLTNIAFGNGGGGNDLVLGTAAGETRPGGGGTDCVLGGGGNDSLYGNAGSGDVCIGGPGNDSFGLFGIHFLSGCETIIQ
ncbi:MAG: hypothetical protein ACXWXQ_09960 [Actinomycetota bacterium]